MIDATEEWRAISIAPKYEVSSMGRVLRIAPYRSTKIGRVLKLSKDRDGYFRASINTSCGRTRPFMVSRLVAMAFHGDPPTPRHEAAHWNGVKADNTPKNIRWATQEENMDDRFRHKTNPAGIRNPKARLTEEDVNLIRSHLMFGERKATLGRMFGVSGENVGDISTGKRWSHLEFQL